MQRSSSHLRNVSADLGARVEAREAITDPSGIGPFAEAMRQLIADLPPAPLSGHLAEAARNDVAPLQAARQRHLRLVR
jgi:hypothetical protein